MSVRAKGRRYDHWILLLPALTYIAAMFAYPLFYSIFLSVHSINFWNFTGPYVGLANYAEMFGDQMFHESMRDMIIYGVFATVLELGGGLLLGVLLNSGIKGARWVRALLIAPLMMTPLVAAYAWKILLYPGSGGSLNIALKFVGLPMQTIMNYGSTAMFGLLIVHFWQYSPFVAFAVVAGLLGISPNLYESAKIDGAGKLSSFRHITLPMLKPLFSILAIFSVTRVFKIIEYPWVITQGGPGYSTFLPAWYIWWTTFQHYRLSAGATISITIFIIVIVLTFALIRQAEKYLEI